MRLTREDALRSIPSTFWRWVLPAAVFGVALGFWWAGRMDNGPRPLPGVGAAVTMLQIYVLGAAVLASRLRTRTLGLLLLMSLFICFFGFVGGIMTYWGTAGWRAAP